MDNKSNIQSDVKRKLITGGIEVLIGVGILIYSAVNKSSLYTYGGLLFAGSGAFTLVLCLLRIFADKKMAQKKELKEKEQTTETAENVVEVEVENVNDEQVTLQDSTVATADTTVASDTETVTTSTTSDTSDSTDTEK